MYRKIDDFLKAYETVTEGTSRLFGALDDDALKQPVVEGYRNIGQIAWHIVVTVPEMMSKTGLEVSSVNEQAPPPKTAVEIQKAYGKVASELAEAVKTGWKDETLTHEDEMYGQKWARGLTLRALIDHEIHHRGQITVLLRQAGRKVPGLMGPAKEEWGQYGMEAPPY